MSAGPGLSVSWGERYGTHEILSLSCLITLTFSALFGKN
jgi:hypothetical protein